MRDTLVRLLLVVLCAAPAAAGAEEIIVDTSAELAAALSPGNAGQTIHVRAGDYVVGQPLVVPDGATLVGDGVMAYDADGLPSGLASGTRTTLRAAATLAGDIVTLGNGSAISGVAVEDVPGRLGGNLVVVSSRAPGDVVSATLLECELHNPNGSGIALEGPANRGLLVVTRNPRLLSPAAPHDGATVAVSMSRSIVRSPGNGSGVFAINFAPRAQVSVALERNVVGGGLDAAGGVSRPAQVVDSTTTISSRRNLYRSDRAGEEAAVFGWALSGGSGPPFPAPAGETARNTMTMQSVDDRIEGFLVAIYARGAMRFFGPPLSGPSNDNQTSVQLHGTRLDSVFVDLWLFGAESTSQTLAPGDGNGLRVLARGVTGSGARDNFYADAIGPFDVLSPDFAGAGNRLEVVGHPDAFATTSDAIVPSPPANFFTIGR
jgi:hypothetical protein